VVSAVKLREGMLYPTVQAYIAHAAGQPRNNPVMTGAGAIVEILKTAGLLRDEAGELVATFDEWPEPEEPSPPEESEETPKEPSAEVSATVEALPTAPAGPAPAVTIHVQVRCTADEIEDLGPKLKTLIAQLSVDA
jgi:pyruvate/2-oxoglutarate dehydrogenase complex dihydrolipoamide acyltransferase (E2) component